MKYIVVTPQKFPTGVPKPKYPVLFPDHLVHSEMVPNGYEPVSAGFVSFGKTLCEYGPLLECFGESESLKLKAHPNADAFLIDWLWTMGDSQMLMASDTYDEEFARDEKRSPEDAR